MAAHMRRLMLSTAHKSHVGKQVMTTLLSENSLLNFHPAVYQLQVRYPSSKHYDPKFRKLRAKKVFKIDLPDFQKLQEEGNLSPDEMREKQKKDKTLPPRTFTERPINISCTSAVAEPFVPPEGDGKASVVSKEGAKEKYSEWSKKGKSYLELRKVRRYIDSFEVKEFALLAQDILIEATKCLENVVKNEDRLHELVTEQAFPQMVHGLVNKTFRWQFVESIEPPRVMQVRTADLLSKENLYAQVTVRFHTKQILAIYDRFGRLMFGSETVPKDCLEYVVFENHIANEYGIWRMHAKIIPDWMPPREPVIRTYKTPVFEPLEDLKEEEEKAKDNAEKTKSNVAAA